MHNLRAELRAWDENAPAPWTPSEGGILVGHVRRAASFDQDGRALENLVVAEERSGAIVAVDLTVDRLAAIVELHSPHEGDKIGVKRIADDEQGNPRFVLIVDDHSLSRMTSDEEAGSDAGLDEDDCATTAEERDFITQSLDLDENDVEVPDTSKEGLEQRISGLIQRTQDELESDPRALQRYEKVVTGLAEPRCPNPGVSDQRRDEPIPAQPYSPPVPARRRSRFWAWAMAVILLASGGAAGAVFYFNIPLPW